MPSLVQSKSSTFSQLFNKKYYQIPKFQRTFAWRKEHVNDFWEDLTDAIDSHKNHFFGSIVLQLEKRGGSNFVYDGQQRLTVVVALISIIAYELEEINKCEQNDELSNFIKKIIRKYIYDKSTKPYLLLTNQDKIYFKKCLLEPDEYLRTKMARKSNEFIRIHVFRNLKSHISEELQQCENNEKKISYLKDLFNFICYRIYFVVIFTDKHFPAATLFEVLNFRGAILQPADLIKNLIYSKADEQRCSGSVNMFWNDNLEKLGKTSLNEFLKHFWILQSGYPIKGNLYKAIKRSLDGQKVKVLELVKKMGRYIDIYVDVLRPKGRARWKMMSDTEQTLLTINMLNAGVCYPLLLSLFSLNVDAQLKIEFTKAKKKMLSLLENLFFRLMVCNKTIPYELEKFLAEFSKRIQSNTIEELNELVRIVKRFSPDDRTFELDFSTFIAPRGLATYILNRLENYHRGRKEPISSDTSKVTIEHIMPKMLGYGWGRVGRYHKDYLNRLGNLTLLSKGLNKGNQSFTKKKVKFYKESNVILTRGLVGYTRWNKVTIAQRQKEMASKAVNVWPII